MYTCLCIKISTQGILARVDIDKLVDFRSKADLVALKPHYKAYEVLDMESVRQYYEIFNIDI